MAKSHPNHNTTRTVRARLGSKPRKTKQPSVPLGPSWADLWIVREFGGPGVVELEEVPAPLPATGLVMVRIHADGGHTAVEQCPRTNSLVTLRKLKGIKSER
jgi:hypothetical protein